MEKFGVIPGNMLFIKKETFGFVMSWRKKGDAWNSYWPLGDNKIILPCKTEYDVRKFLVTLTNMFGVASKDISNEFPDFDLIFVFKKLRK